MLNGIIIVILHSIKMVIFTNVLLKTKQYSWLVSNLIVVSKGGSVTDPPF